VPQTGCADNGGWCDETSDCCSGGDIACRDEMCCLAAQAECTFGSTCCEGFVCIQPSGFFGARCCRYDLEPTPSATECCSQHAESGVCCLPAGAFCTESARCCSGTCNEFSLCD